MVSTLCWKCNTEYDIGNEQCPVCGATNANVDLAKAQAEMQAMMEDDKVEEV